MQNIISITNDFILSTGIHSIPLKIENLESICEQLGYTLLSYQEATELLQKPRFKKYTIYPAFTIKNDDYRIVLFNSTLSTSTRIFAIAHEIGHIVLKHNYHGEVGFTQADSDSEREANTFAYQLLAPLCVLKALNITDIGDIKSLTLLNGNQAKYVHKALHHYREQPCAYEMIKAYGIRLPKNNKRFDFATVLILLTALLLTAAILIRELPDLSEQPAETTSNFFAELKEKHQPQAEVTLPIETEVPQTTVANLAQSETVYITRSGERYHKQNCYHIKNSTTVSGVPLPEAIEEGYTACKSCYRD